MALRSRAENKDKYALGVREKSVLSIPSFNWGNNMRSYFRGRKRKIGIAALVLSCVFMSAWVRSVAVSELLDFSRYISVPTNRGYVSGIENDLGYLRLIRQDWHVAADQTMLPKIGNGPWLQRFDTPIVSIPHWSLVWPMAMIAAWCLLTKSKTPSATSVSMQGNVRLADKWFEAFEQLRQGFARR
jgi:hypothetical protein